MEDYSCLSAGDLVRQCAASGQTELWEEFVRRFHRPIASVVLRTASRLGDPSRQTIDDLIQETYLKLCSDNFRLLRNFDQKTPETFAGFIKVVAANVVRDYFKAARSKKRGANLLFETSDPMAIAVGDWSDGSPKMIERQLTLQEIQHHLELCTAGPDQERKQRIFWLYYRFGLPCSAIATLPGIQLETKGVESSIQRMTKEVRERMVSQRTHPKTPRDEKHDEGVVPASSL
jgi:RNA polymerase sigma-70 factor, ECF subfamily